MLQLRIPRFAFAYVMLGSNVLFTGSISSSVSAAKLTMNESQLSCWYRYLTQGGLVRYYFYLLNWQTFIFFLKRKLSVGQNTRK